MTTFIKEADVQRCIMDLLAAEHIWAMRINTAATVLQDARGVKRFWRSHSAGAGTADILALIEVPQVERGNWFAPLWIECKCSLGGRQSPEQISFQEDVERRGHQYIVASSVDDVIRVLKEIRE